MISLRFRKLYLWIQRIRWAADDQRVTITVFWCKFGVDEWCSLEVQMVKCLPAMRETWVWSWVGKILWRRKWQPTPLILSGKSRGLRSLAGYSPRGRKESDRTEWLTHTRELLSPVTELPIASCHIVTLWSRISWLLLRRVTEDNTSKWFSFGFWSAHEAYQAFSPFQFFRYAEQPLNGQC